MEEKYSNIDVNELESCIHDIKDNIDDICSCNILLKKSFNDDEWKSNVRQSLENKIELLNDRFNDVNFQLGVFENLLKKIDDFKKANEEIEENEEKIEKLESRKNNFGFVEDAYNNIETEKIQKKIEELKQRQIMLDNEIQSTIF